MNRILNNQSWCYSYSSDSFTSYTATLAYKNSRLFKFSIPCEKPWIGLFERVLGLICLWSTGAIGWDLDQRPIDHEPQPLSTEQSDSFFFFFSCTWAKLILITLRDELILVKTTIKKFLESLKFVFCHLD
mgnify:CR=1 FL=1